MENFFLQAVVDDLTPRIAGASLGRVWQPSDATLVLDLRLSDGRFLYVSVEPSAPALYLTSRPIAEIERAGDRAFAALLRKRLRGAVVDAASKPPDDRIATFTFRAFDAAGERRRVDLVVELTGRSANAYLVDGEGTVLGALRVKAGETALARRFEPATPTARRLGPTLRAELEARTELEGPDAARRSLDADLAAPVGDARLYGRAGGRALVLATFPLLSGAGEPVDVFPDPSAAADARARRLDTRGVLDATRRALLVRARAALASRERLVEALARDLAETAGADRLRELAESLLAQVSTAREVPGGLELDDLYAVDGGRVVVPADRGELPQAVAQRLFARHRKARRTREAVAARLPSVESTRDRLQAVVARVESAADVVDLDAIDGELDAVLGVRRVGARAAKSAEAHVPGARRFVSSDGYEVLVGRSSTANDALTFKIARPSDLWLHAADYPGSHVVVRNPSRREVPFRTISEAAQLAAYYSDAQGESLADVRYTPRRFVTKPRGAAPGLVRIARFKTVAVRPSADLDRAT